MTDLLALGELLIDFTECGISRNGQKLFEQNPGGAVANVACAAARLGLRTAFIGKVGFDMHGKLLKNTLLAQGIDAAGLIMSKDVFTTLAFVALKEKGEREFSFARKPGSDTQLSIEELDDNLLGSCKILHVGSISMTDEPARSATLHAIGCAKNSGAVISFDPNYRADLWKSEEEAKEQIKVLLTHADIAKMSIEELLFITGESDMQSAMRALKSYELKLTAITLGAEGAYIKCGAKSCFAPAFMTANAVDTTGAGDCFWAAFLSRLVNCGLESIETLDEASLEEYARFANAAASICITRRGAIPAMPYRFEIDKRLTNTIL